jgi:hypothetical protein
MNPIVLLEHMTYLRHSPADGFSDSPEALIFKGSSAVVRFDKSTGRVTLDPPDADLARLLQALQALASQQEREERAAMLARLAKRPY